MTTPAPFKSSFPWLPAIPYPPPREDGYWAPITSTLDWCEENYYATHYSAEIVNTLTNLLVVYLSCKGMYNCYKYGHELIFLVTFAGFLVVGSGSFAFHATLKYPMQLVDELSMIYTTCLMLWATFEHGRSRLFGVLWGLFVASLAISITLYYHYLQDPTFHQNAYALLTAIVLIRAMVMQELYLRPYFQPRREKRDKEILIRMWVLVAWGLTVFLGGFAIWNLDNIYCSKLRRWRYDIGLPWGLVLEGHGWWHIGTGLGAYSYIVWGIWLRHCLNGKQDEYELIWPSIFTSVPRLVRVEKVKTR
ncbi:alkaline phytoceramidase [Dissoconium aciculare CBS 342.82]|uniref:Alkaline phytoceramidase n=1 Tax=Dissoconium aciculare CBS 342.82 TaxID=1314786 RepID=A0A6J3MF23_9PEZI|nr:alkaline phytoceramidase [Dissoconium aciculare CBS 342.82]KAF1826244.1 alkaline phytoceramidase [Dissoconium aciculare CBS 342.82]